MTILVLCLITIIGFTMLAGLLPPPPGPLPQLRNLALAAIALSAGVIAALLVAKVKNPELAALVIPICAGGNILLWLRRWRGDDSDDDDQFPDPIDWNDFDRQRGNWRPLVKS